MTNRYDLGAFPQAEGPLGTVRPGRTQHQHDGTGRSNILPAVPRPLKLLSTHLIPGSVHTFVGKVRPYKALTLNLSRSGARARAAAHSHGDDTAQQREGGVSWVPGPSRSTARRLHWEFPLHYTTCFHLAFSSSLLASSSGLRLAHVCHNASPRFFPGALTNRAGR